MGQAKRRGTFAERREQAIARRKEALHAANYSAPIPPLHKPSAAIRPIVIGPEIVVAAMNTLSEHGLLKSPVSKPNNTETDATK